KPAKKEASMERIARETPAAELDAGRAFELDPARLESSLADASPSLRRGIQFVRGRSGATLDAASANDVLHALAQVESRDYGLPSWSGVNGSGISVPVLGPNGTRPTPFTTSEELALRFGTREQWLASLAAATREARFATLEKVTPALATMPLEEMIGLVTKPHFSSGELHDAQVERLVTLRDDDPLALAEAARTIGREDYPGQYMREQLLVHAIGRMGARGIAVPEGLEREPKWDGFSYCVAPWRGSKVLRGAYRRAMEAVGRDRALALVAPILDKAWGHAQALPILSVYFDEPIARRLVAEKADQALADPDAFGTLGASVIPLLVEALEAPSEPSAAETERRDALAKRLRAALAFVGASGGSFDASHDRWVSCATEESYWREEAKVMLLHSLRAMPEPRRIATLDRLFAETKQVERAFLGVQTVSDAAFRTKAARLVVERFGQVADRSTLQAGLQALLPDGLEHFRPALGDGKADGKLFEQLRFVYGHDKVEAIMKAAQVVEEKDLARLLRLAREHQGAHPSMERTRIYLLERKDLHADAPARRAGSFSSSRGAGPVGLSLDGEAPVVDPNEVLSLDQVLAMKKRAQKRSEDEEHVLTLDLEEIPELAARHPGARALSLFARFPDTGDEWESGRLVPVPSTCTAPSDGSPLTVVPLEVPRAIFDHTTASADPMLKELRGLVFNRPGYALGEPMFIQDDEGPGAGFVMQLGESIGDLNLGDSGSLYVFDGAVFMQCY
ncbi:MAG: hypothetical protein K1X94_19665, partial [Sandaracinaceae bacterium]|nr:hypothetical protein [Sandaracinaceae bacterium]